MHPLLGSFLTESLGRAPELAGLTVLRGGALVDPTLIGLLLVLRQPIHYQLLTFNVRRLPFEKLPGEGIKLVIIGAATVVLLIHEACLARLLHIWVGCAWIHSRYHMLARSSVNYCPLNWLEHALIC